MENSRMLGMVIDSELSARENAGPDHGREHGAVESCHTFRIENSRGMMP